MIGQTLQQFWNQGLTLDAFISQMDSYQADMRRRLTEVSVALDDSSGCQTPCYVSVLTESWCSDSLMNLPIVVSFIRHFPEIELRVFLRSQFPELRQAYQEAGIINIPAVTFLDTNFNVLGTWVERPQKATGQIALWKQGYPEMELIRTREDLGREEKRALLMPFTEKLLAEMEIWYKNDLQQETVAELNRVLKAR